MGVPRVKFRDRPKKTGAKKKIRVKAQKKRLVAAGFDEKSVNKLTDRDIRTGLKAAVKKKKSQ